MKKAGLGFLSLLLMATAHAGKGLVTVLNAPVFGVANEQSRIIFNVRKGEVIYIHPSHFSRAGAENRQDLSGEGLSEIAQKSTGIDGSSPISDTSEEMRRLEFDLGESTGDYQKQTSKKPQNVGPRDLMEDIYQAKYYDELDNGPFYLTIDKRGHTAYIPKKFVKLISEDEREDAQGFPQKDVTDYRIKDPLPVDYPFIKPALPKAYFGLGLGTQNFKNINAGSETLSESYGIRYEFFSMLVKDVSPNLEDRISFGGMIAFSGLTNKFQHQYTSGVENSTETKFQMGLGPVMTFNTYRGEENNFILFGGIHVNLFNQVFIQSDRGGDASYRGFSLGPRAGFFMEHLKIAPQTSLILGSSFQIEFPYEVSGGSATSFYATKQKYPFQTQLTFFVGFGI